MVMNTSHFIFRYPMKTHSVSNLTNPNHESTCFPTTAALVSNVLLYYPRLLITPDHFYPTTMKAWPSGVGVGARSRPCDGNESIIISWTHANDRYHCDLRGRACYYSQPLSTCIYDRLQRGDPVYYPQVASHKHWYRHRDFVHRRR